jgi:hypothetical protein
MAHHQQIEQVPGTTLWIETWSWSDSTSPFFPWIRTTVGGEVNIWREKPPDRTPAPTWLKVLCSIFPFNLFCLLASAVGNYNQNKKKWKGTEQVGIRLSNSYYDRAGVFVEQKDKTCTMENTCEQSETANGFSYIAYPQIGANLTPVVTVQTEADISVGHHTTHHRTWEGPVPPP